VFCGASIRSAAVSELKQKHSGPMVVGEEKPLYSGSVLSFRSRGRRTVHETIQPRLDYTEFLRRTISIKKEKRI
jgi:hypothetical protein